MVHETLEKHEKSKEMEIANPGAPGRNEDSNFSRILCVSWTISPQLNIAIVRSMDAGLGSVMMSVTSTSRRKPAAFSGETGLM
jgi:hypothetical protein